MEKEYKFIAEAKEKMDGGKLYTIAKMEADSPYCKEFVPVEQFSRRDGLLKIEMYNSLKEIFEDPAFKDVAVEDFETDENPMDLALAKAGLLPVRGLSQYLHGAEKRFLIKDDILDKEMFKGEGIPEETGVYDMLYPIGGSNSSGTEITELFETSNDIIAFLKGDCEPDYEDPELVDLAECYLEFPEDGDYCSSCTDEILKILKLTKDEIIAAVDSPRYCECKAIIEDLQSRNEDMDGLIDLNNPWYGNSESVTYCELTDAYEAFKKVNNNLDHE